MPCVTALRGFRLRGWSTSFKLCRRFSCRNRTWLRLYSSMPSSMTVCMNSSDSMPLTLSQPRSYSDTQTHKIMCTVCMCHLVSIFSLSIPLPFLFFFVCLYVLDAHYTCTHNLHALCACRCACVVYTFSRDYWFFCTFCVVCLHYFLFPLIIIV